MNRTSYMMTADDIAKEIGCSKGHAYKIICTLNEELHKNGYTAATGKLYKNCTRPRIVKSGALLLIFIRRSRCS